MYIIMCSAFYLASFMHLHFLSMTTKGYINHAFTTPVGLYMIISKSVLMCKQRNIDALYLKLRRVYLRGTSLYQQRTKNRSSGFYNFWGRIGAYRRFRLWSANR